MDTTPLGAPVTASQPGCPTFTGTYQGSADLPGFALVRWTDRHGRANDATVHASRVQAL